MTQRFSFQNICIDYIFFCPLTISLGLLHRPALVFKFLNSIVTHSFYRVSLSSGNPDNSSEFPTNRMGKSLTIIFGFDDINAQICFCNVYKKLNDFIVHLKSDIVWLCQTLYGSVRHLFDIFDGYCRHINEIIQRALYGKL